MRTWPVVAALAVACNSSATPADLGGPTARLSGIVLDYSTLAALAGANVCIYAALPAQQVCTQTDGNGAYVLTVPASGQLLLSYSKTSYISSLLELLPTAGEAFLGGNTLITFDEAMQFANALLAPIETAKPILVVQANRADGTRLSGATVSATFITGDGPFYFDEQGLPSKSLTATSSTGLAAWVNTAAGDVEVTVHSGATACPPKRSWPGNSPGSSLARLIPGYSTTVGGVCP